MTPFLSSRPSSPAWLWLRSVDAAIVLVSFSGTMGLRAALVEDFSYSNGNLTTVSSGAWQFWEAGAGNATVVNGAARFDGTTDLIRTYPAVLMAPGQVATFSFTMNVTGANTTEAYQIAFAPASAPFTSNTNYGSGLILFFDYLTAPAGMSSIQIGEGLGTGNFNVSLWDVGFMSVGVTHTISVNLSRGAANTAYSLFLDNTLLRSSSFVLNDARAINAVELAQTDSLPDFGSALIDQIRIVPEPATCLMFMAGGIALLNLRRRQSSP